MPLQALRGFLAVKAGSQQGTTIIARMSKAVLGSSRYGEGREGDGSPSRTRTVSSSHPGVLEMLFTVRWAKSASLFNLQHRRIYGCQSRIEFGSSL